MKTLNENVLVAQSIDPGLYDNETVDGASVDTAGYESILVVYSLGDTDTTATFEVEDSADDSSFADVLTDATEVDLTATDDGEVHTVELLTGSVRRYIRVHLTAGDGTVGANAAAYVLLGRPDTAPVSQEQTVPVVSSSS